MKKNRPEWQYGLLNGLGGHIEDGESSLSAMIREFKEESGVDFDAWNRFCELRVDEAQVSFYRGFAPDEVLAKISSTTDEEVYLYRLDKVFTNFSVVPNLQWLIPLALTKYEIRADVMMR